MKKRILVLLPAMPQESDRAGIASTLTFLEEDYDIDFLDPLCKMHAFLNGDYFSLWRDELEQLIPRYDVFFGFSFGGVILQQCLSLFVGRKKSIVLFSTPSFKDETLGMKLGKVVQLCQEKKMQTALATIYQDVFYPNPMKQETYDLVDEEVAAQRMIFGLQQVLATDSRAILAQTVVDHLHLIGEFSNLVNQDNVVAPHTGVLLQVPGAGMRVLEDNPEFCKKVILERLNRSFVD